MQAVAFTTGQRRAGAYAQRRYKRGLRSWRAAIRLVLLVSLGPFVAAGLVGLFATGQVVAWGAGLLAGVAVGAWITLRESPPAYIENWHLGAGGECKTGRALAPLKWRGWRVVHDVDARLGNYDHIAVGAAGVFLLESKNPVGVVELQDGVPVVRRRHDPDASSRLEHVRRNTLRSAASLKEDLERRSGKRTWVQAVVVFWSPFPEEEVDDGRCIFVHGRRLRAFMRERPARLSESDVAHLGAAVAELARD